ncbi:TetR/AcrR family transcriptional regulator [Paenibacillus psychroresistens]|uniref:TetR/AcrR family transcriptional regulator n=1 Tax=Paenibacillus psychroresistens TaxID=1778678 RepID=A0A6B8RWP7_9BACL|nr:TetR/AcrR family transcriptional regulator [Paenibacillus psychroresistens]QGQ99508.1 TetR/AcrR family transcriptional regulator [Paenibacillus psychroresistens]
MEPNSKRTPGRPKANNQDASVKELILRTASQLFMEFGYDQISLEQIAKSSGVTKASVYYYYVNKANLFTAAVVQMMTNIRRYTLMILERKESLRQRLTLVAEAYLHNNSHVNFDTLMKEATPSLSEEQLEAMRDAEMAIHLEMANEFQAAMDRGEIAKGNVMLLSYAFSALMMIGNRNDVSSLFTTPKETATEIVALFWDGATAHKV